MREHDVAQNRGPRPSVKLRSVETPIRLRGVVIYAAVMIRGPKLIYLNGAKATVLAGWLINGMGNSRHVSRTVLRQGSRQ